jgi:hypothetical protein
MSHWRYYPSNCLEVLRNTTKRTPPEYKSYCYLNACVIDGGERRASRFCRFNQQWKELIFSSRICVEYFDNGCMRSWLLLAFTRRGTAWPLVTASEYTSRLEASEWLMVLGERPAHRASQKRVLEPVSQHLDVPQLWGVDINDIPKLHFHQEEADSLLSGCFISMNGGDINTESFLRYYVFAGVKMNTVNTKWLTVKLLLALASTVILGSESHGTPWPIVTVWRL